MTRVFEHPAQLLEHLGEHLGHSDWIPIEQSRIDQFAEATGDHQWIHVDPLRAASGPFGACIAHGYLTLALVNLFLPQIVEVRGLSMGVNYGCEKVRFPNVVRVGSRVRGSAQLIAAEEVKGGIQATIRVSVDIEGEQRPGCVVDTISRYYPA
ncbi:MaoC family dehydratase [Metapseudomonas furukawaii]|uniref:Acyl dehydratase n=1 Tax=Metapseudomonas furukawaii TaxID=1149133 RepID=A0AAD1FEF2_METFU|nr:MULTISPECIES: MaoC family dehydratase [Pseudomonas]ELS27322.1 Acyl dehydratase [Pseudomonas furukawaii]OWJ97903.1 dehydratase [Pseudomonas sp. A46]WAG80264.1 MaoC family dehydratase [Pseudomonas furukawaii]BAU72899.1 acyl dehydratase [Pseudomonas furukawaii]